MMDIDFYFYFLPILFPPSKFCEKAPTLIFSLALVKSLLFKLPKINPFFKRTDSSRGEKIGMNPSDNSDEEMAPDDGPSESQAEEVHHLTKTSDCQPSSPETYEFLPGESENCEFLPSKPQTDDFWSKDGSMIPNYNPSGSKNENPEDPAKIENPEDPVEIVSFPLEFDGMVKMGEIKMRAKEFVSLLPGEFMDDNVLFFFLEYLKNVVYAEFRDRVEILGPSLVTYISNLAPLPAVNVIRTQLADRKLLSKKVVLAIIHNANHWSLLVLTPCDRQFYHLDSLNGINFESAKSFAKLFYFALEFEDTQMQSKETPHQNNFFDCGLHVIVNADRVLYQVLRSSSSMEEPLVDVIYGLSMRSELIRIVQSCADLQL